MKKLKKYGIASGKIIGNDTVINNIFNADIAKLIRPKIDEYKQNPSEITYINILDVLMKQNIENAVKRLDILIERFGLVNRDDLGIVFLEPEEFDMEEAVENFSDKPKSGKTIKDVEKRHKDKSREKTSQISFGKSDDDRLDQIRKDISQRVKESDPEFGRIAISAINAEVIKAFKPTISGVSQVVNGAKRIVRNVKDKRNSVQMSKAIEAYKKLNKTKTFLDELSSLCKERLNDIIIKNREKNFNNKLMTIWQDFRLYGLTSENIENSKKEESKLIEQRETDISKVIDDLVEIKYGRLEEALKNADFRYDDIWHFIDHSKVDGKGDIIFPEDSKIRKYDLERLGIGSLAKKVFAMPKINDLTDNQIEYIASKINVVNGFVIVLENLSPDSRVGKVLNALQGSDFIFKGIEDIKLGEDLERAQDSKDALEGITAINDLIFVRQERQLVEEKLSNFPEVDYKIRINYGKNIERSKERIASRRSLSQVISANHDRFTNYVFEDVEKISEQLSKSKNKSSREQDSKDELGGN